MNIENPPLIPAVSFCTTVMDRLHHLRKTLPENIAANLNSCLVEFVVLDYSSKDGLEDWIRAEMHDQLRAGLIVFAQLRDHSEFHIAHAKNVAHRLARGNIVCNLDADIFSGTGFASFLKSEFSMDKTIYVRPRRKGLGGLLAFRRSDFFALGGYDEQIRAINSAFSRSRLCKC